MNRDVIRLIMDTVDMEDSEFYQSSKYGDLLTDGAFPLYGSANRNITYL